MVTASQDTTALNGQVLAGQCEPYVVQPKLRLATTMLDRLLDQLFHRDVPRRGARSLLGQDADREWVLFSLPQLVPILHHQPKQPNAQRLKAQQQVHQHFDIRTVRRRHLDLQDASLQQRDQRDDATQPALPSVHHGQHQVHRDLNG